MRMLGWVLAAAQTQGSMLRLAGCAQPKACCGSPEEALGDCSMMCGMYGAHMRACKCSVFVTGSHAGAGAVLFGQVLLQPLGAVRMMCRCVQGDQKQS